MVCCYARFLAGICQPRGCRQEWRHGKPEARSTNTHRRLRWFFDPSSSQPAAAAGSKNRHTRRIASACLPEKTWAKALCLFMLRGTAKAVP
jgi:hypothetical protein